MEFGIYTLIFMAIFLGKSLADLRGQVDRKELVAAGSMLGLAVIASGWLIYDQDHPYTGLAAVMYSEETLAERKEVAQEIKELNRISESIIAMYQGLPD